MSWSTVSRLDYFDEGWRSPTGLTRAEIQPMRDGFNRMVAAVNVEVRKVHAIREAKRQELLKLEADIKAADEAAREAG